MAHDPQVAGYPLGPPEMVRHIEQTTVARPVTKRGVGLHTGAPCAVTLQPAAPSTGIAFVSEDGATIPAAAGSVSDTQRGTTLRFGAAAVGCVEHLMAALYGLGVDNVLAEVTGPELPACDGSAREWVGLIAEAGLAPLGAPRRVAKLSSPLWVGDESGWAVALPGDARSSALRAGGLRLALSVHYRDTIADAQSLWLRLTPRRFARELAPARTFVMERELQGLRELGLARGGSEDNAFVVGRDGYSGELRFPDEVVRHKALDLVGDLALCGWRFGGTIVAVRPSHRTNVALAGALRAHFEAALAEQKAVGRS
ncbi:MAG: UDP-3-O-acyl-N-acetylglucosamine deacetylase [Armatimonadota bacterium]